MQVVDWLVWPDIFSPLSAKSSKISPLLAHTHKHTPTILHFPSSFPIDVSQRHWCCTSSCLTSEFSSLSSGLHILCVVFLAPMPENTGLFAYKGQYSSMSGQQLQWRASSSFDTNSLNTDQVWQKKNVLCPSQEENKSCKTCSIIIDENCSYCWIVYSPFWQHASNQHMNLSAPLWSFVHPFCRFSIWLTCCHTVNQTQLTPSSG